MYRSGQFIAQYVIDQALTIDAAAAVKGGGDDFDPKMSFSPGPGADMARMQVGFVNNVQHERDKRLFQLVFDAFCDRHQPFSSKITVFEIGDILNHGKRHVLAWAFIPDHTAVMATEVYSNGTVLDGAPGTETVEATCAHPDCRESGAYRAPRSRHELTRFYWFCLEHVREYNAAWNYFADMDDAAVEAEIRKDIVWQRPTWPLGTRLGVGADQFHDPLSLLGDGEFGGRTAREAQVQAQSLNAAEREALSVLGMVAPVTRADIKQRYKILAKSLHPDANGGDKKAEERLKSVNHAYTTLKDSERLT